VLLLLWSVKEVTKRPQLILQANQLVLQLQIEFRSAKFQTGLFLWMAEKLSKPLAMRRSSAIQTIAESKHSLRKCFKTEMSIPGAVYSSIE
jgi:hypothetical protein